MKIQFTLNKTTVLALAITVTALTGCQTNRHTADGNANSGTWDNTHQKTTMGALMGAIGGALLDKDQPVRGALIGATAGGFTGYVWGDNQDDIMEMEAAKLREQGIKARYDRERRQLLATITNDQLRFAFDSAVVQNNTIIRRIANAATSITETKLAVRVNGYASSEGEYAYNQQLSEKRAANVASKLINLGVSSNLVNYQGYGETKLVMVNGTEDRKASRRVEFVLSPVQ